MKGKKKAGIIGGIFLMLCLLVCPLTVCAYSGTDAVNWAKSHCSSNHTEYKTNCPNGWICAEFVANCVKQGGLNITPSNLAGVRTLYNKLKEYGTSYELQLSTQKNSSGDYYIQNTGANAGKISVGDVIITKCTKHDLYLHAILVSGFDSNGYVYAYAHNANNFNRKAIASRCCKSISYEREDYSNIKTYVIHFNGNSGSSTTTSSYYAAVKSTATGGLALNDKPASSSAGKSTELITIPIGAVCTVYPSKASGNWYYVTYKGVSGYAYGTYLTKVTRTATDQIESAHPHRKYNQYSNGYKEILSSDTATWAKIETVQPTCTTVGYTVYGCTRCSAVKTTDYLSETGHKSVNDPAVAATCATSGKTAGSHCSTCGKVLVAQTTIPATGNHTKTTTVSKKATTTTNGKLTTKCSTCGKTLSTKKIYNASVVKLSTTTYTYNGKVKTPNVIIKDSEGNTISSSNYTVTKASGRKNVGKYTYKITFKNRYSGTKTLTFKIKPKAASLTSLSRNSKAFTVKWNKISAQATGYEIMYATNSSFTKNTKTATVSSYKTTSKKITGLKANTKYYVKIRTYKTVNGVKYYSSWSKYKTVTTK